MPKTYVVPATRVEVCHEVKKSRFIAQAAGAQDRDAAMAVLAEARGQYPDARHHCWAYVLGDPASASSAAMSDDGEPSGTAGKPILNVLQHKAVGDIMLVVTRYFGGVKLGAGGLVRAYSAAAQLAMDALPVVALRPTRRCRVSLPFALESTLRWWADSHGAQLAQPEYSSVFAAVLTLDESDCGALQAFAKGHGITVKFVD